MAVQQFRLPDPGEGLVEAEIVTWHVGVGDVVQVNDIVVEVETSKSLVELPIPYAGRVTALLAAEGDLVDVGAPIILIDDEVGAPDQPAPPASLPPTTAAPAADAPPDGAGTGRVPVLVGYGPRTTDARRRPRRPAGTEHAEDAARAQVANSFSTSAPVSRRADDRAALPRLEARTSGDPLPGPGVAPSPIPGTAVPAHASALLAKPPVRKLAKDLGVDLAGVAGSGPGGVISRDDVLQAAAAPTSPAEAATPAEWATPTETRIPIRGVRKATAEAMVASAFTAPHVTEWLSCDVTASMELLERLRARREFADLRISPLLLVAKAVCLALARTPELNSRWDEAAGEIVLRREVNLGIAAATPRGLLVPNIKSAQARTLPELAEAINSLAEVARAGKSSPADLAQGSFTITNVGTFGIDAGTPILNPGEAGILCFGSIARRPWVVGAGADERIEPRWVTTLALSFDHRLVDGEQGSRFLSDVAGVLADPGLALLF